MTMTDEQYLDWVYRTSDCGVIGKDYTKPLEEQFLYNLAGYFYANIPEYGTDRWMFNMAGMTEGEIKSCLAMDPHYKAQYRLWIMEQGLSYTEYGGLGLPGIWYVFQSQIYDIEDLCRVYDSVLANWEKGWGIDDCISRERRS